MIVTIAIALIISAIWSLARKENQAQVLRRMAFVVGFAILLKVFS